MGTPDYMPPELLAGSGADSLALLRERHTGAYDATLVDVWSCGVLLYLLCTGAYPFESPTHPGNVLHTLANISGCSYRPLPPHLSPQLQDLIQRILCPAGQRLTLEQVAQHPWVLAHGMAPAPAAGAEVAADVEVAPMELSVADAADAAAPGRFSFHAHHDSKPTPATPRPIVQLTATPLPPPAPKAPTMLASPPAAAPTTPALPAMVAAPVTAPVSRGAGSAGADAEPVLSPPKRSAFCFFFSR